MECVEIIDDEHVRVLGHVSGNLPEDGPTERERLQRNLAQALYSNGYVTGGPAFPGWARASASLAVRRAHMSRLESARLNTVTLRDGATVLDIHDEIATVGFLGLRIAAPLTALDRTAPLVVGETVGVWIPNERRASSPGFWSVFGRVHPSEGPGVQIVRLYWNVCADGAPELVRELGRRLDEVGVGFRLKLLWAPHMYGERTDAAVLYLKRDDWASALPSVSGAYSAVSEALDPETPLFTQPLAPGLAWADDPGGTLSFGQHRCNLVATGLIRAWEGGATADARMAEVDRAFSSAGVDPGNPHLGPGLEELSGLQQRRKTRVLSKGPNPVQIAQTICRRIASEAIWYEDRCSWFAPMLLTHEDGGAEQAWGSLNADLYDGTAGVSLVLAEAAVACGDPGLAATAAASIRHALRRARDMDDGAAMGLFAGRPGVSLAARRVAALLGCPSIEAPARDLAAHEVRTQECDVANGLSGAILAALAFGSREDIVRASRFGDLLLENCASDKLGRGASLAGSSLPMGSAGVGLALAELFDATGIERFGTRARQVLAEDNLSYDRSQRNWQKPRALPGETRRPPEFRATWCRGAPGIALSRLGAWQILGDGHLRREAIVALRTTERVTRAWLRSGRWNFSLCHGLAGNAEVLRLGADLYPQGLALADLVMRTGAQRIAARDRSWPCGVPDGEPPSLMNGLAGIAHAYLRMYDATIPSVLLPRTGTFVPQRRVVPAGARDYRIQ